MFDADYSDPEARALFVMQVVREAEKARDDFLPRWEEAWSNYLVLPSRATQYRGRTDNPLARDIGGNAQTRFGRSVLKDPESHQIVESLLAETMTQLFPDDGYVKARPTGGEDFRLGTGVNKIVESVLGMPRHRRVLYQWLKDAFITGTGVAFGDWDFEEDFEIVRTIQEVGGFETSTFNRLLQTVMDDVRIDNVDLIDFYPVPGADNFQDLKGAARRVELFGPDLIKDAAKGIDEDGWMDSDVIEEAAKAGFTRKDSGEEYFKDYLNEDSEDVPMHQFDPVTAFEYWGEVPWAGTPEDTIQDGSKRRRLLVVNGQLVREQDWPLKRRALPFFDFTINPMTGRLYGLSPLEVIRFDQDFADVLKGMLADAVVKSVNPPHIVNVHQGVSPAKVAAFRSDVPITVEGDVRTAIAQAEYRPPIDQAQSVYEQEKTQMREAAGAQGGVQGQGLGSKRFSATESANTFRSQFARPNMVALLIEGSALPPLGDFILDQYALHIEDNRTLVERFGEDFGVTLDDLQGKHNIRFVGGRREHDRLSKASAMERFLAVVGQVPEIRAMVPWQEFLKIYADAVDLGDLKSLIGQNETLAQNTQLQALMSQFQGQGGGQSPQAAAPASDAELAGGPVQ